MIGLNAFLYLSLMAIALTISGFTAVAYGNLVSGGW